MKMTRYALVASAALSMGLVGFGASGAGASPSNAPSVRTGLLDCGSGPQKYPFTVNNGNSQAAVTWSPLSLTFFDPQGNPTGTGNFVPSSYDVTIVSGGQISIVDVSKGNAPGPNAPGLASCEIVVETGPDFSLSGAVAGRIVVNG
jgi:hypothetical protein